MTFREQWGIEKKFEIKDLLKTIPAQQRRAAEIVMRDLEEANGIEIWGIMPPTKMFEMIMKVVTDTKRRV